VVRVRERLARDGVEITLSMSRHQFVWPTFRQTIEALCEALDAAWRFFDGVVQRVALDNMRTPPGSTILAIGGSTGVASGTGLEPETRLSTAT